MTKLQGDDRPTYIVNYPRWVRLGRFALVTFLVLAALVRWVLAWYRFLQPAIAAASGPGQPARIVIEQFAQALAAQPVRYLIAAHLGLLLTGGAIAFVYAFLPDLSLADEGLAVRTLLGWRVIPWSAVRVVRITSMQASKRRIVLIQGRWSRLTLWPRLVSACLGAGWDPGVFFTSAVRDFKPLVKRLYHEVNRAAPDALFDHEFYSLPAHLVLEPATTLADLTEQSREEGWPLDISAQAMASVAAGLVLVQMLMLLLESGAWWKPLALILLVAAEWGIGAFYLYALAELFPGEVEYRQAALLYPLAQVPRGLMSLVMAMFVCAGVPFVAAMLGLVAVIWAVTLTALLVQQLFRLESVLPAMIGGAFQALLQFIVLGIIFGG